MKGVTNTKLKSFAAIALLSTLLLFSTIVPSSGEPSPVTLQYDRNDPDYAHSGTDPLAVRFTPPRIWLGTGHICTLFEVTAISLHVSSASWVGSAGFDVYVTDENHQTLKSFLNQHPTDDGWFNVDLTGWTDDSRYVETHFFIEFVASLPNPNLQETWAMLSFDEATVDEGEASCQRSYRYTLGPDNPITPAWLPIELTYPYGPGDLMIRVELQPQTPNSFLPHLINTISEAQNKLFKDQAPSAKATLIKKINEAISMFEKGNYRAGFNKLENDIAPKLADPRPTPLADPRPTPRTSWLNLYQEGSDNQKLVTSFAVVCQGIVQMAQKSASTIGSRERCDFNGDGRDDLAVGVPHENIDGHDDAGAVQVFYGSNDGITEEQDQYWRQGHDGVKGTPEDIDCFGEALAIGDFNGDGYDDLAIGAPNEDIAYPNSPGDDYVGGVNVLYGSSSGLTGAGDQEWYQNSIAGAPYVSEAMDNFGTALAAGDFNGDGWDDLAIGVPGENSETGEVDVLYGSLSGLTAVGNQVWSQDSLEGADETHDFFGRTLTVGDFNGDGYEDLAIGVPREDVEDIEDAGAVNVVYGSPTGLTVTGNQLWHQNSPLVQDTCETDDFFGGSLAAGDFNGDDYDDLAIGVPGEALWADGSVNVIFGSSTGLSAVDDEMVEPRYWLREECTDFHYFGASLAVGDFDQDGYEDLAVGVPGADIDWGEADPEAGAVYIQYGCSLGLPDPNPNADPDPARCDIWLETDLMGGVPPYYIDHNRFGRALTVGDFNGDAYCDLAIGAPNEDIGSDEQAGLVRVMYSYSSGVSSTFSTTWWQDKEGVDGDCEEDDYFGSSLPGSHWQGIWP